MLFNSRFYLSGKHAILFIEDFEEMRLNPVMEKEKNDFTKGSVTKNIINLAVPMTLAQLINVLYSIVDRIYIGRMGQDAALALGGVGITFPIITIIMAFANLIGMGGAPLCSIERGKGNQKKAEEIMGNSFFLLILLGLLLTAVILIFKKPIIYAFGASEATFPYADSYITIYLLGSVFCDDRPWYEQLHKLSGFCKNRDADSFNRRRLKYYIRSCFYLYPASGCQGSGSRNRHFPVCFLCMGPPLSRRQKNNTKTEKGKL